MYPEQQNLTVANTVNPTQREMENLGKTIAETNRTVEELHARLQSVLRDQPKSADGAVGGPQEVLSALPNAIRNESREVARALYTLKSILSRLEI